MKKWKLIKSDRVFGNKWLSIDSNSYELPNGKIKEEYYHLNRPDYVLIVAIKNNELLVVKQYRRGVDEFVYELPAGWIDKDETPEIAAARELAEETGCSGKAILLGKLYPQPGFSSMLAFVVLVDVENDSGERNLESDEFIEHKFINLNYIKEMITNNEIKDMGMLSAINLYQNSAVLKF